MPEKKNKPHIKKPLNAFMLFMKEQRAKVVAECTLKESAAINQILGRRVSGPYLSGRYRPLLPGSKKTGSGFANSKDSGQLISILAVLSAINHVFVKLIDLRNTPAHEHKHTFSRL